MIDSRRCELTRKVAVGSSLGCQTLALTRFLRLHLRCQVVAEVLGFEDPPDLHFLVALSERRAADPLDRLLHRLHLPQPEAGDQLLGLGEWSVGDGALAAAEAHPHTFGARVQSLA